MLSAISRQLNIRAPLISLSLRNLSTAKDVRFGSDVRSQMLNGVEILSDAVSLTLGPKGRNVIIEQSFGAPKITKDGVTVAKSIDFKDRFQNMGASLIKQVANNTNEQAGDGTTTATILARSIFKEGCKSVAAGINPMDMCRGIKLSVEAVMSELKKMSKPISSREEICQVATISANGDAEIGELIANAMEKVGKEGVVTVGEGKSMKDELEVVEGMKFDRGFISPYFITNPKTQKCELDNPYVLIFDKKISSAQHIVPILENILSQNHSLLIICEDVEGEALATLIINKLRQGGKLCAVKAPGFGDNRKAILQDIAILTGGTLITEDTGLKLEKCSLSQLGRASKVLISKDDTVVMDGYGEKKDIEERCSLLRLTLDNTTSEYEKDKIKERLAKLSGGVAVIKVGGGSDVEVSEKKDRVNDSLNATRAAVEEGVVAGGGVSLLYASHILKEMKVENFDFGHGINLVAQACRSLTYSIAKNAGVEGAVVVEKLLQSYQTNKVPSWGYNAAKDHYEDLYKAGIIDPLKVVRSALSNAASVASLMTTTEAAVVEIPEDKKEMPQMAPNYDY